MPISPAKLLIVLVIGVIVLGPDKLPVFARQLGAAWGDIRKWRQRIEAEVRGNFPDLPDTTVITSAVRNPIAILNKLADEHESRTTASERENAASQADSKTEVATQATAEGTAEAAGEPTDEGADARDGAATATAEAVSGGDIATEAEAWFTSGRVPAGAVLGKSSPGMVREVDLVGLAWPSLDDPSFN